MIFNRNNKPLIRYRFKDNSDYVFYINFKTDRDAKLWYERNKEGCSLKEYESLGFAVKPRLVDCLSD